MLKQLILFFLSFFLLENSHAQQPDSAKHRLDSIRIDSLKRDSLSLKKKADSIAARKPVIKKTQLNDFLKQSVFLNTTSKPVSMLERPRKYISKDGVFYILAVIILFLGILRAAYPRYFNNLIRVFFNTSLRQGQLTDQLLQARLPSMLFNIFFVLISGAYLYLLLNYFEKINYTNWEILLVCIVGLLLIYIIKFCTLKFVGWLTGYKQEAETYIFIVFLINKIISLCLVPIVIIIPFSTPGIVSAAIVISYVIIALMFLMRFFRSYGLLQSKLSVSGLHFFLYIIGIELLPLLLIYKYALVIMSNKL